MPFLIVRNNIADMEADAIVNTANPRPVVGTGVDTAIHEKAGPQLLEARKQIGTIPRGAAAVTPAFGLSAKYVIHTVGPIWYGGGQGEAEVLRSCYTSSLALAEEYHCDSIAFPLISSGNYGFPKDLALQTAISTISEFLMKSDMMVYLVVFDKKSYALSEKLFQDIESYIDEKLAENIYASEYHFEKWGPERSKSRRFLSERRKEREASCRMEYCEKVSFEPTDRSLEDLLNQLDETFSEALLRMIDERGLKDPDVYKRANISKQHFSKIKNTKDYQPKKSTALAFAVALKLNLDETKDLIGKAGYLLTESSKFDIIVEYFIERNNYDIFEINEVLFAFTDQILGS